MRTGGSRRLMMRRIRCYVRRWVWLPRFRARHHSDLARRAPVGPVNLKTQPGASKVPGPRGPRLDAPHPAEGARHPGEKRARGPPGGPDAPPPASRRDGGPACGPASRRARRPFPRCADARTRPPPASRRPWFAPAVVLHPSSSWRSSFSGSPRTGPRLRGTPPLPLHRTHVQSGTALQSGYQPRHKRSNVPALTALDLCPSRATMRWEMVMPHLSPQTLTQAEQRAILRATRCNPRDHLIYSLALGTGLRLAEIVGLNVGDVYPRGKAPEPCPAQARDR